MGQFKLGIQAPAITQDTIDTLMEQIRTFSGENVTIRGKTTESDEDGVSFVTFELDIADQSAFKAQCRAWLDEDMSYRWTIDSSEDWPNFMTVAKVSCTKRRVRPRFW
jgi:hypothetical protein